MENIKKALSKYNLKPTLEDIPEMALVLTEAELVLALFLGGLTQEANLRARYAETSLSELKELLETATAPMVSVMASRYSGGTAWILSNSEIEQELRDQLFTEHFRPDDSGVEMLSTCSAAQIKHYMNKVLDSHPVGAGSKAWFISLPVELKVLYAQRAARKSATAGITILKYEGLELTVDLVDAVVMSIVESKQKIVDLSRVLKSKNMMTSSLMSRLCHAIGNEPVRATTLLIEFSEFMGAPEFELAIEPIKNLDASQRRNRFDRVANGMPRIPGIIVNSFIPEIVASTQAMNNVITKGEDISPETKAQLIEVARGSNSLPFLFNSSWLSSEEKQTMIDSMLALQQDLTNAQTDLIIQIYEGSNDAIKKQIVSYSFSVNNREIRRFILESMDNHLHGYSNELKVELFNLLASADESGIFPKRVSSVLLQKGGQALTLEQKKGLLTRSLQNPRFEISSLFSSDAALVLDASIRSLVVERLLTDSSYAAYQSYIPATIMKDVAEACVRASAFLIKDFDGLEATIDLSGTTIRLCEYADGETTWITPYGNMEDELKQEVEKSFVKIASLPANIEGTFNTSTGKFTPTTPSDFDFTGVDFNIISADDNHERNAALAIYEVDMNLKASGQRRGISYDVRILGLDNTETQNPAAEFVGTLEEIKAKIQAKKEALTQMIADKFRFSNRTFGIEIEMASTMAYDDMGNLIGTTQVEDHYRTSEGLITEWEVKSDGSIETNDDDEYPIELVSPVLQGEEGLSEIKRVLELLNNSDANFEVQGRQCGFHIHHDCSDLLDSQASLLSVAKEFYKIQEPLYKLCSTERQQNSFCSRLVARELNPEISRHSINGGGRRGVNIYSNHGTIEFRMRESTLNVEEVLNWVRITHQVVNSVVESIHGEALASLEQMDLSLAMIEQEKLKQLMDVPNKASMSTQVADYYEAVNFSKMLVKSRKVD